MVKNQYIKVKLLEDIEGLGEENEILKIKEDTIQEYLEAGMLEIIEKPEEKKKKGSKKEPKKETSKKEEGIIQEEELSEDDLRKILRENYGLIKEVIQEYSDIDEKYVPLIAAWIIGTYAHKEFESYPYLFINAMRGSGKSRLLKLIASLCSNGEMVNDISEAVLFRTPPKTTLLLDEFEGIGKKESSTLRELLNSAYKKGAKVKRMKKKKGFDGEEYVVEEFNIYFPIAMANIWGMEEVLGDRCITIFLDKSSKPEIIKLMENFDQNYTIKSIKRGFTQGVCSLCSVVTKKNINHFWNDYIKDKYKNNTITTFNTYNIYTNNTTLTTKDNNYFQYLDFFNKIDEANIDGRNLEISFPLFVIGNFLGNDIFEEILSVMKEIIKEKSNEEKVESRDVSFLRFLTTFDTKEYLSVTFLAQQFIKFMGEQDEDDKWINSKWVGRALRRLRLSVDKRRSHIGIQVLIDFDKVKEKFQQYE